MKERNKLDWDAEEGPRIRPDSENNEKKNEKKDTKTFHGNVHHLSKSDGEIFES